VTTTRRRARVLEQVDTGPALSFDERIVALADVSVDFERFLSYVKIDDPNDPSRGLFSWLPWQHLRELARMLVYSGIQMLCILKARQIGVSWLLAAYALWKAMFFPGSLVILLSQGQTEAQELLDKCRRIHRRLPPWMQVYVGKDNTDELEFTKLGSRISALPSTERAGRSFTATLIICDEHAFHPYAEGNFAAMEPTINNGGQIVSCSTANGVGNFFHKTYTEAKAGLNNFTARFYSTFARPGRNEAWYQRTLRNYTGRMDLFHQEYPRNDEEAFRLTAGIPYFEAEVLERLRTGIRTPIRVIEPTAAGIALGGYLHIFEEPSPGERYVCGVDISYGLEGDNTVAQIINWRTGLHVASAVGKWRPEVAADLLAQWCEYYRRAYMGPEANGGGGQYFLRRLQAIGYYDSSVLYYRDLEEARRKGRPPEDAGWITDGSNRPLMLDELEEALRRGFSVTYDEFTIGEMGTFTMIRGKAQAAPGCNDDSVLSYAIGWQVRQRVRWTLERTRGWSNMRRRTVGAGTHAYP